MAFFFFLKFFYFKMHCSGYDGTLSYKQVLSHPKGWNMKCSSYGLAKQQVVEEATEMVSESGDCNLVPNLHK